jgi:hypothetical protein
LGIVSAEVEDTVYHATTNWMNDFVSNVSMPNDVGLL